MMVVPTPGFRLKTVRPAPQRSAERSAGSGGGSCAASDAWRARTGDLRPSRKLHVALVGFVLEGIHLQGVGFVTNPF